MYDGITTICIHNKMSCNGQPIGNKENKSQPVENKENNSQPIGNEDIIVNQ
jgi:hypothetical protein